MQKQDLTITKGNALVEAAYRLTLAEQRLLLLVISKIDSRAPWIDGTPIEVTAQEVVENYGLQRTEGYSLLREAADQLFLRVVIINNPDLTVSQTRTRWVSAIDYLPDSGRIRLLLAPRVMPYLTQLAKEFTTYRLKYVSQMRSIHAIRLYEMLVQWRPVGSVRIEVDTLKQRLGIAGRYAKLQDFKRWVVNPAVEQINAHSDLWVQWEQHKRGRVIHALTFTFGPKQASDPSKSKPKSIVVDRAYIEKHAHPGESWDAARARLQGLVDTCRAPSD